MRVAVLGAGIMGASCARWLAQAGHETTVFDQFEPGHSLGSSHGVQKIVRQAYPDPFHTGILVEAHRLWRELEAATGTLLYHQVGLAYIAPRSQLAPMAAMLGGMGVPNHTVDAFPEPLKLSGDEAAVVTPEAGWVSTERALQGTIALARRAGANVIHHKVETLSELDAFDLCVVAAGAWTGSLLGLRLRPTMQSSAYIRGRYTGPVWIEGFGTEVYGFPNEAGANSFKVGYHAAGPEVDPTQPGRPVDHRQIEALVERVQARFGIESPVVEGSFACIYTRTADERFRIGFLDRRTIVVSACSGHGYKFAPWIGQLVCGMAEGRAEPPGEFALSGADRSVDTQ